MSPHFIRSHQSDGVHPAQRSETNHYRIPPNPARRRLNPITHQPATMLSFSGSLKVFVAVKPCDTRLTTTALALLLDDINMRHGCQRPWYQLG